MTVPLIESKFTKLGYPWPQEKAGSTSNLDTLGLKEKLGVLYKTWIPLASGKNWVYFTKLLYLWPQEKLGLLVLSLIECLRFKKK